MISGRIFPLLCALLLFAGSPAPAAGTPSAGPGPKDRCAVCGMFVAPYPNWVALIEFRDGTRAFFDGPKDLFIYFFDLSKYRPGASPEDISGIYVTEYYTTRQLKAEEVFFVPGSDVIGPMGNELVPVAGMDNAETFKRDHRGSKIMKFDGKGLIEVSTPQ